MASSSSLAADENSDDLFNMDDSQFTSVKTSLNNSSNMLKEASKQAARRRKERDALEDAEAAKKRASESQGSSNLSDDADGGWITRKRKVASVPSNKSGRVAITDMRQYDEEGNTDWFDVIVQPLVVNKSTVAKTTTSSPPLPVAMQTSTSDKTISSDATAELCLPAHIRPGLPITIITGYLGSGKTTLLNKILRNQLNLKVAVFVNEFGTVNIDKEILLCTSPSAINETDIVTLQNGCVCCTINADLVANMVTIIQRNIVDYLVIETSGVCDLVPLLDTFVTTESICFDCYVETVLTVVDADAFYSPLVQADVAAIKQIAHADIVVLNKMDLFLASSNASSSASSSPHSLASLLRDLHLLTASPDTPIIPCSRADFSIELLLDVNHRLPIATSSACSSFSSLSSSSSSLASSSSTPSRLPASVLSPSKVSLPVSAAAAPQFSSSSHPLTHQELQTFTYATDRPLRLFQFEDFIGSAGPIQSGIRPAAVAVSHDNTVFAEALPVVRATCSTPASTPGRLDAGVVRAKGLIWFEGFDRQVIFQLSGRRSNPLEYVEIAPAASRPNISATNKQTIIVFIGRGFDDLVIAKALDACLVH